MRVTIIKMRRDGVAVRKSVLSEQTEHRGFLTINETHQNHLHRMVKIARLFKDFGVHSDGGVAHRTELGWINDERLMVSEFEHIMNRGIEVDYAQSWLCLLGWEQSIKSQVASEDRGPTSRKR